MGRHCFGSLVVCGSCGRQVSVVEATSWIEAASGLGRCDECVQLAATAVADQALAADIEAAAIPREEDTPVRTGRYKGG